MAIIIEREDIMRISEATFPDGKDIVGEAVEYHANCGCRVTFGIRYKGGLCEKCVLSWPCEDHPKLLDYIFEAGQKNHPMYDEETDKVVAWAILSASEARSEDD